MALAAVSLLRGRIAGRGCMRRRRCRLARATLRRRHRQAARAHCVGRGLRDGQAARSGVSSMSSLRRWAQATTGRGNGTAWGRRMRRRALRRRKARAAQGGTRVVDAVASGAACRRATEGRWFLATRHRGRTNRAATAAQAALPRVLLHGVVDQIIDAAFELARHLLEVVPQHVAALERPRTFLVGIRAHGNLVLVLVLARQNNAVASGCQATSTDTANAPLLLDSVR